MSTRAQRVRSRLFRLLKKAPMAIGCMIFLSAVFFPYLRFIDYNASGTRLSFSADTWSFKITFHHVLDYEGLYMGSDYIPLPELSWINIMMLIAQTLVLATGIASLFVNKNVLAFAPPAFCLIVTLLIMYVSIRIGHSFFHAGYSNYSNALQTGFYFTLLSWPFYLIAFTMKLVSSRRRKQVSKLARALVVRSQTQDFSFLA